MKIYTSVHQILLSNRKHAGQLTDNANLVFNGTNVGIGSTVPAYKLDVDGTLYASGAVMLGSTLGVAGNLDVNGVANDIAGTLNLSGNALTSSAALTVRCTRQSRAGAIRSDFLNQPRTCRRPKGQMSDPLKF